MPPAQNTYGAFLRFWTVSTELDLYKIITVRWVARMKTKVFLLKVWMNYVRVNYIKLLQTCPSSINLKRKLETAFSSISM